MTQKTRIVLVDDHTLFRKGLAELLEQSGSIEVSAFTGTPDDVAGLLKAHRPDVLILDLNMPGTDGITLMQQLRAADFDLPVLILTLSEAEDDLARALRAGANGYLLKSMEPDEVVDAIQRAQRGELSVPRTGLGDVTERTWHVRQVAWLAVAVPEPGEDAAGLQVPLHSHEVKPAQELAVVRADGHSARCGAATEVESPAADTLRRPGHVAVPEQRHEVVGERAADGVLEVEDARIPLVTDHQVP